MTFPPELVEQIIDDLARENLEPWELLAFSVVARAWRPRALSHVFRSIRVSCLRWHRTSATAGLPFDPDTFTRMQDSAPHLLRYLRNLAIRIDGNDSQSQKIAHFARTLSLPAPCAVQTFGLEGYSTEGPIGLFDDFAVRFPALRRVELRVPCMLPLQEIAKVTAVAHELAFVIPGAYSEAMPISAVPGGDSEGQVAIPNLRSLDLENSDSRMNTRSYDDVTRICACAPNLQRVAVTGLEKYTLERFVTASSAFNDLIQDLQFDVEKLTQDHLDGMLLQFPNLRVLRLNAHGPDRELPFPSAAKTLERLCFTVNNVDAVEWSPRMFANACGWPALDYCASSRAMMPSLRKLSLTFVVENSDLLGWEAALGAVAKSHLPLLYSAGMLEWSATQSRGRRSMGGRAARR